MILLNKNRKKYLLFLGKGSGGAPLKINFNYLFYY